VKRGGLPAPTKAQRRRMEALKSAGCLICAQYLGIETPLVEIHHQNLDQHAGQARISHDHTIAICPWHHQGTKPNHVSVAEMLERFGPNLKMGRWFRDAYGSDAYLLHLQNEALGVNA